MRQRILCMYSGGVDSTGMLYEIMKDLKYSSFDIHVHHISLINVENRYQAELKSVLQCLKWLQDHFKRKILFTKNVMDFTFLQPIFPVDGDMCAIVAGQILRSCNPEIGMKIQYKYIAYGTTKSDLEYAMERQIERYAKNDIEKQSRMKNYETKIDMIQAASPRTHAIINASVSKMYIFDDNEKIPEIPERLYPVLNMSKIEIMQRLPKDLLKMTWSCRTPIFVKDTFKSCNKCKPCEEIKEIMEKLT